MIIVKWVKAAVILWLMLLATGGIAIQFESETAQTIAQISLFLFALPFYLGIIVLIIYGAYVHEKNGNEQRSREAASKRVEAEETLKRLIAERDPRVVEYVDMSKQPVPLDKQAPQSTRWQDGWDFMNKRVPNFRETYEKDETINEALSECRCKELGSTCLHCSWIMCGFADDD